MRTLAVLWAILATLTSHLAHADPGPGQTAGVAQGPADNIAGTGPVSHTGPRPPNVLGCYEYNKKVIVPGTAVWRKVPCLTAAEMLRLSHPQFLGIQSKSILVVKPGNKIAGQVAGFISGDISVSMGPGYISEYDTSFGVGSYSVQLNTNYFNEQCSPLTTWPEPNGPVYMPDTASNLSPLKPICIAGSRAWVQFVFQEIFKKRNNAAACIWNIDVTRKLYNYPYTYTICVRVANGLNLGVSPITISGGAQNHLLSLVLTQEDLSFAVVAPDWYGLCLNSSTNCSWNQVSGGVMGQGSLSTAIFGPTTTEQVTIGASSCDDFLGGCSTFAAPINPLRAFAVNAAVTGESTNLTYYGFGLPTPVCDVSYCQLSYTASVTPPP